MNEFLPFISQNLAQCPANFYESVTYCAVSLLDIALKTTFLDNIFIVL